MDTSNAHDIDALLDDVSIQTELQNWDAVDGLDDYLDPMREVETVLEEVLPVSCRGAADRTVVRNIAPALWPQGLVVDLALGIDSLEDVLLRFNVEPAHWLALQDNRAFRIDLARTRKEISESGLSFKRKAATQAEMYLSKMDALMDDDDVSPATKHTIFRSMTALGELEPKKERDDSVGSGMAFNIQINM